LQGVNRINNTNVWWYNEFWALVTAEVRRLNIPIALRLDEEFARAIESRLADAFKRHCVYEIPFVPATFGRVVLLLAEFYRAGSLGGRAYERIILKMEDGCRTRHAVEILQQLMKLIVTGEKRLIKEGRMGTNRAYSILTEVMLHRICAGGEAYYIPEEWKERKAILSMIGSMKARAEACR